MSLTKRVSAFVMGVAGPLRILNVKVGVTWKRGWEPLSWKIGAFRAL